MVSPPVATRFPHKVSYARLEDVGSPDWLRDSGRTRGASAMPDEEDDPGPIESGPVRNDDPERRYVAIVDSGEGEVEVVSVEETKSEVSNMMATDDHDQQESQGMT
jgi:hypothetical protein